VTYASLIPFVGETFHRLRNFLVVGPAEGHVVADVGRGISRLGHAGAGVEAGLPQSGGME
jgi:hypothetical protein